MCRVRRRSARPGHQPFYVDLPKWWEQSHMTLGMKVYTVHSAKRGFDISNPAIPNVVNRFSERLSPVVVGTRNFSPFWGTCALSRFILSVRFLRQFFAFCGLCRFKKLSRLSQWETLLVWYPNFALKNAHWHIRLPSCTIQPTTSTMEA